MLSKVAATGIIGAALGTAGYVAYRRMNPVPAPAAHSATPALPEKTRMALEKAIREGDEKTKAWIEAAIEGEYEGAGVIFTKRSKKNKKVKNFVLGVNKKKKAGSIGEAEYIVGKRERGDGDRIDTAKREVEEEAGLHISRARFSGPAYPITGGTTGYPFYVYFVELMDEEYEAVNSPDGTFTRFIEVPSILDRDIVTDISTGDTFPLRKFNVKYVFPQIADAIRAQMAE